MTDQQQDPIWQVDKKGGPMRRSFEISVLRSDNQHGIDSYGWMDQDTKIFVACSGGPCNYPVTQFVWDRHLATAQALADHLNATRPLKREAPEEDDGQL